MIDVSNWHTVADNPPDRVPLMCYCEETDEVFLGFAIHPYVSPDRTINIVNWYYQPRLHQWFKVDGVTRWKEVDI